MQRRTFEDDGETITVELADDQVTIRSQSKGRLSVEIDEGYVVTDRPVPEWAEGVLETVGIEGVVRQ